MFESAFFDILSGQSFPVTNPETVFHKHEPTFVENHIKDVNQIAHIVQGKPEKNMFASLSEWENGA